MLKKIGKMKERNVKGSKLVVVIGGGGLKGGGRERRGKK